MTPYEEKTLKDSLQEEKTKLKEMSLKDKLWYIWEYYKLPIIGVVIGSILLISIGGTVYHNSKYQTAFTYIILNSTHSGEENSVENYLDDGFRQFINLKKTDLITVDHSLSLSFDDSSSDSYSYAEMMKVTAMISSKELDVMIANPDIIDHYGSEEGYMNLEEFLPEDLYEKVKNNLYTVTIAETGQTIPCGIKLYYTDFAKKAGLTMDYPVLGVMCNTTHKDRCLNLIRYLFGLEAEIPASSQAS